MLMPAPMKRVNLFILSKDESKVMRALGRLKLIHFEPAQGDVEVPLQEKEGREKPLERNRRLLMRIEEIMADFGVKADGPAEEVSQSDPRIDALRNRMDEYYISGIEEFAVGNLEKAIGYFEKALKLDPDFGPAREYLNEVNRQLKNRNELRELQ